MTLHLQFAWFVGEQTWLSVSRRTNRVVGLLKFSTSIPERIPRFKVNVSQCSPAPYREPVFAKPPRFRRPHMKLRFLF